MPYDPHSIEKNYQALWDEAGVSRTEMEPGKPKYYCLEMFMYPSGKIHMGHVRNYTIGDVVARFRRQRGESVLHPMGFDAFGLPAENAAIQGGAHPQEWTRANIASMVAQLRRLGFLYDWNREVRTCDPGYYRWNQWFFLKLLERGLAYKAHRAVNWCPDCSTVLANEQVEDGNCWRCHHPVTVREMDQWFLRITDYAQELLDGLDTLQGWPDEVVSMQRNWIGRSEGAELDFAVEGSERKIRVFTTRIDTIYGATFVVLAPEHPLVPELVTGDRKADLEAFLARMRALSTRDRATSREKDGVFTGTFAVNPFSGEKVPIYLANFVLMEYGTGAIMSVPAHDQRDYEFARQFDLPVRVVVQPGGIEEPSMKEASLVDGALQDSGPFSGMANREAMAAMARRAEESGFGKGTVNFRLKDWGISRQRYWGTPIPVVYCDACGAVPVPEDQLPVLLPKDVALTGKGHSPLAGHAAFVDAACPKCGKPARRETDTMDTFVDSSWYFLRYCDNNNEKAPFAREKAEHWCPVDFYIGGIEHATMHLIYFRFFTKALRDMGLLSFGEPVKQLLCQGMVIKDGAKMSKSLGNIVDPDAMIAQYGADAVRLNILFVSPPKKELDWKDSGAEGAFRFLHRVAALVEDVAKEKGKPNGVSDEKSAVVLRRKAHQTLKKVTGEMADRLHFNTAIASLMELVNAQVAFLSGFKGTPGERFAIVESAEFLVQMLAPLTPHLADHLWNILGHRGFLVNGPWPAFDPRIARDEEVTLAVQVNGKVREQITVPAGAQDAEVLAVAKASAKVKAHLEGKTVIKELVVPGRIVNFVVR
jgi:leucyl-tRNA synthetase